MPRSGMTAPAVRAKAMDVTLAHMRRHGHERVRLAAVAKELGVSHVALYAHFTDRAALLDAVTERWLNEVIVALEVVCASKQPPLQKIYSWFLQLYRLKRERILRDPELYRAFDAAAETNKHFVAAHIATLNRHLLALTQNAAGELGRQAPRKKAAMLFEATAGFHHPKLMINHCNENREALLRNLLRILLAGMAASVQPI